MKKFIGLGALVAILLIQPAWGEGMGRVEELVRRLMSTVAASTLTGTVAPANGGLGQDASAVANGKVPIGNGSGFTLATVTPGTGFAVTSASGAVTIDGATADSNGLALCYCIRKAFSAGAGGSADDITIWNANAPFACRILDVKVYVSGAVALSTAQLRSATGGGGSALSQSFATTTTGLLGIVTSTATTTVSAGGTLVLRRSDNAIAGEVVILVSR